MPSLSLLSGAIPVFFRLMPALVIFPAPGIDRLPAFIRVMFCLALSVCLSGAMTSAATTAVPETTALIAEFLLGLALALGIHACFAGIHTGAHLIDTQAGTNSASIFNPAHQGAGVFSEFLVTAAALTVLLSDAVLIGLGRTLSLTPASFSMDFAHADVLLHGIGVNLVAGFLLTFPVIAGLWLMDVLAALSSRLLPQANIYFLFLPIKTLFATLLLVAYSAAFLAAANRLVRDALVM